MKLLSRWISAALLLVLLSLVDQAHSKSTNAHHSSNVLTKDTPRGKTTNKQTIYSTHDCLGIGTDDFREMQTDNNRTCRFQNLCYDQSDNGSLQLLYFAQASDQRNLSDGHIELFSSSVYPPRGYIKIRVIPGPIPQHAATFRHEVAVFLDPVFALNFGHQLADNMFTYFFMQHVFRVADPRSSQWLFHREDPTESFPTVWPSFVQHSALPLTLAGLRGQVLKNSNENSSLVCFRTFIAGTGKNNFFRIYYTQDQHHYTTPAESNYYPYWMYRCFVLRNVMDAHGADIACGGNSRPTRSSILILEKKQFTAGMVMPGVEAGIGTGAGIGNALQLHEYLAKRFPNTSIAHMDLADLPFKQQVQQVMHTQLMFSHAGGGMFAALLLPRDATLAMLVRMTGEYDFFSSLWLNVVKLHEMTKEHSPLATYNAVAIKPFIVNFSFAERIVCGTHLVQCSFPGPSTAVSSTTTTASSTYSRHP